MEKENRPFIRVGRGVPDYIAKLNEIPHAAKDLFLWELVRIAADALFEIRLKTLYEPHRVGTKDLFIDIIPDQGKKTLSIVDNGLGMTEDDLEKLFKVPELSLNKHMEIAHQLVENRVSAHQFYTPELDLSAPFIGDDDGDDDDDDDAEEGAEKELKAGDLSLGFFSAFMVADSVHISSKRYGVDDSWPCLFFSSEDRSCFFCDVRGDHASFVHKSRPFGTTVTLHLKEAHFDYLDVTKLKLLIDKYPFELCPYPVYIRGVSPSGKNIKVQRRLADVEEERKYMKWLEFEFEGLRKRFEQVLVGPWPRLKHVVISDRYYDLPAFLPLDKKTFYINPKNWIIKELKKIADLNPPMDEMLADEITFLYLSCKSFILLYKEDKYHSQSL